MIVFEDGIEQLVAQIPMINDKPNNFHWGSQDELNRYIALKDQPYPLFWLIASSERHDVVQPEVTRDCRFIIAIRELNHDQLNDYRLKNSYKNYLNLLSDRLIEGLNKFSITDLIEKEYKLEKHPNYSESGKNKTIDLWDATTIDCKVKMNGDKCLNTIKWKKK